MMEDGGRGTGDIIGNECPAGKTLLLDIVVNAFCLLRTPRST